MAKKKGAAKPRSRSRSRSKSETSKSVGEWVITCEGDAGKHPWAEDLPAGAEFQITRDKQDKQGPLYFEPGPGCEGAFKGDPKLLTEVSTRIASRAFHDGRNVTAHSFRLRMTLDGETFELSGFRQSVSPRHGSDEGVIAIHTVPRSLDQSLTRTRRPVILSITHGGPHGEPKSRVAISAAAGAGHKLIGRWKIVKKGKLDKYPWTAGLPKGARFEITEDLEFVPGDGCRDLFDKRKKAEHWVGRLPLRHEGKHKHVPLLDDETLRLTLSDGSVITLNGSHKPKPGKSKGRVSISGPRAGLAGLTLTHGGPHGEPD